MVRPLTVLKQAQNITTVVLGEGHKTVITFDLHRYEKAVKLQTDAYRACIKSPCFPAWRGANCHGSIALV